MNALFNATYNSHAGAGRDEGKAVLLKKKESRLNDREGDNEDKKPQCPLIHCRPVSEIGSFKGCSRGRMKR